MIGKTYSKDLKFAGVANRGIVAAQSMKISDMHIYNIIIYESLNLKIECVNYSCKLFANPL